MPAARGLWKRRDHAGTSQRRRNRRRDGPRVDGARTDGPPPPDGGKTPDRGTTKDSGKTPDSRPNADAGSLGQNKDFGLFTRDGAQGVAVRQSLVERSGALGAARGQGFGIYLGNSASARFSANVVRSNENRGLAMRNQGAAVTSLVIEANAFSANAGAGIALQQFAASQAVKISGNVVEVTRTLAGQPSGDGIQVGLSGGGAYSVQIENNTVSSSARSGIYLEGVGGTIQTNTVSSNTKYGVLLQQSPAVLGSNSFAANSQNSFATSSLIEAFGVLPTPIP